MSTAFCEGNYGVVMAARRGERLVGWFSTTAADAMFLSEPYCRKRHDDESESNFESAGRGRNRLPVNDEARLVQLLLPRLAAATHGGSPEIHIKNC